MTKRAFPGKRGKSNVPSLYACKHAVVTPRSTIQCEMGYRLRKAPIPLSELAYGKALKCRTCYECADLTPMGEEPKTRDKGWTRRKPGGQSSRNQPTKKLQPKQTK